MPIAIRALVVGGILSSLLLTPLTAQSCTTFASVGSDNFNGGLIIAKNRDSLAAYENLQLKRTPGKNTYLGLFYNTSDATPYPFIAAGINEHGLSVVQNESASLTDANEFNDADQSAAIFTILENYSSVAAVLEDKEQLFGNGLANFLIIGDKSQAVLVEVGPNKNQFEVLNASANNNRLYHTNHYVLNPLRSLNKIYYPDSEDRFATIKALMSSATAQYTADGNYYGWVSNATDGPLHSILRQVTVASWIAAVPESGTPTLNLRFTSPAMNFQRYQLTLTPEFWSGASGVIAATGDDLNGFDPAPVGSQGQYTYSATEL